MIAPSREPAPTGLGLVHEHGRSVRVTHDGNELARYVYVPWDAQLESPRPYLHPLRTLGGDLVSLYRPHDHVWHKGIAFSLPNVGSENFWGGTTYRRGQGYSQLPNDGAMRHQEFDRLDVDQLGADPQEAHIGHRLAWVTQSGDTWFTESRSLVFSVQPHDGGIGGGIGGDKAWSLAFSTAFTNVSGAEVVIGSPTTEGRENAGYGGLFWRGPRSFTGGRVRIPGASGGDELMGVRAPWMAFTGRHDDHGRSSTVLFVDDPGNADDQTQWFVRSQPYACLCPAPFFSTEVNVAAGETVHLRHAVLVVDGDPGEDGVAAWARTAGRALTAAGDDLPTEVQPWLASSS